MDFLCVAISNPDESNSVLCVTVERAWKKGKSVTVQFQNKINILVFSPLFLSLFGGVCSSIRSNNSSEGIYLTSCSFAVWLLFGKTIYGVSRDDSRAARVNHAAMNTHYNLWRQQQQRRRQCDTLWEETWPMLYGPSVMCSERTTFQWDPNMQIGHQIKWAFLLKWHYLSHRIYLYSTSQEDREIRMEWGEKTRITTTKLFCDDRLRDVAL